MIVITVKLIFSDYKKFRTFFRSGSLIYFDRLFAFLIFLQGTLKMVVVVIDNVW